MLAERSPLLECAHDVRGVIWEITQHMRLVPVGKCLPPDEILLQLQAAC